MGLEKYWYEASPFMYTALSGFMLGRADSVLLTVSSIVLLSAAGTITLLRRKHSLEIIQEMKTKITRRK